MSTLRTAVLPIALLMSALVLSACATKPKEEPVVAPAPVQKAVEAPPAPVPEPAPAPAPVIAEPAPAPVVVAEQPVVKPVVKHAKKKAHKAKVVVPKEPEPAPVSAPAPAPVVQQPAPVVAAPEPTPAPVAVQPVAKIATPNFFEQYWIWLVGILVIVAGFFLFTRKK